MTLCQVTQRISRSTFRMLRIQLKVLKLHAFKKFEDTVEAVSAATAIVESKVDKTLKKFLKKNVKTEKLAVSDSKLEMPSRKSWASSA